MSLTEVQKVKPGREVFTCSLNGPSCSLLEDLSCLDLYAPPLNKATRGGERFIFHSTILSKALTRAVRSSGVLAKLAGGTLESSFEFVNYVFRCNKFAPGDAKFASHLDTPYYDRARSHVSKYTVILYLKSGQAQPLLRVGDVKFRQIDAMTCVIFDQSSKHEGKPFLDSEKIFIRSELVFTDELLSHDTRIASLFSEACYMTGHSIFDEDLALYAHECFERANSLHWAIERESDKPPIYLHKRFRGVHFLTNGYDYWFKQDAGMTAVDFGLIAVLDYFNCKIDGVPFRSLCRWNNVRRQPKNAEDIWDRQNGDYEPHAHVIHRMTETRLETLVQKRPKVPFVHRPFLDEFEPDEEELEDTPCCPFHCYWTFDAWNDKDVRQEYKKSWKYTRSRLLHAPLLIFNKELVINESSIKVVGDKLFFRRDGDSEPLPSLNFAACWADAECSSMITVDQEISAPDLLLPPLTFHKYKRGYHLVLDFFRNDWMVKLDDSQTIPLPVITNDLSEGTGDCTFWEAAGVRDDGANISVASEVSELDTVEESGEGAAHDWSEGPPNPMIHVDVEKQCGVTLPDDAQCARSLTCKSHSMTAKRAVPGRSLPYEILLQAYQKKTQQILT